MKRTLCLLLSVILLAAAMAPAAQAQNDGDIRIICKNWSCDIPVTQFRFEYNAKGADLIEGPKFFYTDENGELHRETGILRNDRTYKLTFCFYTCDSNFLQDDSRVTLNCRYPNHCLRSKEGGGWLIEIEFDIPVYQTASKIRIEIGWIQPGGRLYGAPAHSDCINSVGLTILQGDTPDAPEIPNDGRHTYELGQTYLFRFEISPELNVDFVEDYQLEFGGPLEYCPELTKADPDGIPGAYIAYAKYECREHQPIEVVQASGGEAWINTECGTHVTELYPGYLVKVSFSYSEDLPEYELVRWELEGVTVPEELLYQRSFTFRMPDNPVKITPVIGKYAFPYTDVDQNDWFYAGVRFADVNGLTKGVTDTLFGPYRRCTRAQFTAYLMRLYYLETSEIPEVADLPFTDVPKDAWYYDYLRQAYAMGLISGKTATAFDPHAPISRAEAVTILWRYSGGYTAEGEPCPFTDVARDAYYYEAVRWANVHGIVQGVTPTRFAPKRNTTRAEALTLLIRH